MKIRRAMAINKGSELHHQGEFLHNYYTFQSVQDNNHDGVVRIFVGLSCEPKYVKWSLSTVCVYAPIPFPSSNRSTIEFHSLSWSKELDILLGPP